MQGRNGSGWHGLFQADASWCCCKVVGAPGWLKKAASSHALVWRALTGAQHVSLKPTGELNHAEYDSLRVQVDVPPGCQQADMPPRSRLRARLRMIWGREELRAAMPYRKFKSCERWNESGDAHELTFSCFRGLPLLGKDQTRRWMVDAIRRARQRYAFDLWAYVIMPEHVHLIIRPRRTHYDISRILFALKWPVARWALAWLRRNAPAWIAKLTDLQPSGKTAVRFWERGGGFDRNIFKEKTLAAMIEYVHANPVRRGLVAEPRDWMWSSASWYEGRRDVPLQIDDTFR
jgi:putative transposase